MKISIIIPTLNEEKNIGRLVNHLKVLSHQNYLEEIIVCDAGSQDTTQKLAREAGATVLQSPECGRAVQMNYAVKNSTGEVLYFVHADVLPPVSCLADIVQSLEAGHKFGCFCYNFDSEKKSLKFNALLNKFDWMVAGGGDQTMFIGRDTFYELNRFKEDLPIMEDFDFVWRAKKKYKMHVVKKNATVSARKFKNNSYLRVQVANVLVFFLFRIGISPNFLSKLYKGMLN
ncbi:MAG: rSAM/selenodomain-associated transferase 2 [Paraglaciecola sp.]|jgi:rSAM/selenodomain-associated transferase 2